MVYLPSNIFNNVLPKASNWVSKPQRILCFKSRFSLIALTQQKYWQTLFHYHRKETTKTSNNPKSFRQLLDIEKATESTLFT